MTVNINDLTGLFTNPNLAYTAVSVSIKDIGSSANSLMFHLSLNGNTKFSVDKTGAVRINADPKSNTQSIFSVYTNDYTSIRATPQQTIFSTPLFTFGVAESWIDITSQGQDIRVNAYNGSVYYTETSHINSFEVYEPQINGWGGGATSTTITIVLKGPTTFANSAWANVSWSSGVAPSNTTGPTILTFMQYFSIFTPKWFGVIAGKNFA